MRVSYILLFCLISISVYSQEDSDTLNLKLSDKQPQLSHYSFDPLTREYLPFSGTYNTQQIMVQQFLNIGTYDFERYTSYIFPGNSFHSYYRKGFSFYQNTVPLAMGVSWHLKETFDWDKWDLFFDSSGLLINVYNDASNSLNQLYDKKFYWQMGAGVGYEYKPGNTIFIKASVSYQNTNQYGFRNIGGMNMKF